MRIGLLFLVLQSVLLCAAAQAEPDIAQKKLQVAASGALESSGGGDDSLPQDGDIDAGLQRSAAADPTFPPAAVVATRAAHNALPAGRCLANIIRGPPLPA